MLIGSKNVTFSILFLAILIIGCSDSNTSTTDGNNTGLTGTLTGKISMADYRDRAKIDRSGVLVQCDGTSYSAITDSGGNWTIYNLPSRTYSISFLKEGCYTWKDLSYPFLGGGLTRYFYMYSSNIGFSTREIVPMGELPRYTIALDGIVLPYSYYSDSLKQTIYVPGAIYGHTSNNAPTTVKLSAYVLTGTNPALSIEERSSYNNAYYYSGKEASEAYSFRGNSINDSTVNLTVNYFYTLLTGFTSGQTVYVRVYPGVGTNSYYDAVENKVIPVGYSTNGSNVLSAVIP